MVWKGGGCVVGDVGGDEVNEILEVCMVLLCRRAAKCDSIVELHVQVHSPT